MTLTHPLFSRRKNTGYGRRRIDMLLTDAWRWWIAELAACVPQALRRRFAGGRVHWLLVVDAAGDNLIQVTGDGRRPLGRLEVDAPSSQQVSDRLPRTRQGEQRPIAILLDTRRALHTTASLPLAAERNLAQVIGFEFERLAPFKQIEVYFAYRVTARDKAAQTIAVELTIVPQAALANIISALARLDFRATEIQVAGLPSESPTTIAIANDNRIAHSRRGHLVNFALGIIATFLAIACIAIPLWQDSATLDSLNAQIANARRQAETSATLQKQIDAESHDHRFLIDRKNASPTVTELLATLTQLFPDDTYLTELDIKGDEVRMVGLTGSATALLAAIVKSPSFRDASFESSITRDTNANRERFDIGAHIAKRGKP
jgi:general secretion pathway protein L